MSWNSQRNRLRSFTSSLVSRFFAVLILSSFAVALLPIVSASAEKSSMPCCAGKSAAHCDSGLTTHKAPAPEPEPMCGLTAPSVDHAVTIVAEPVENETQTLAESPSTHPAAESASVEQPCPMSCGACTTAASREQKRQKDVVQAKAAHTSPSATTSRFETLSSLFSSNEKWTRISPRGPPPTR
jgi:hypothetical protein